MLLKLCNTYPEDPFLWNYLGKLYLDIGRREKAIDAFEKSNNAFAKAHGATPEIADTNKLFNE